MVTKKTSQEIEILREGGRRLAIILRAVAMEVKPGVRTDYLNAKAEELIANYGDTAAFLNYTPKGVPRPYPASLCVSINDEVVHGIPNENPKVLKEGDVVSLDLGLIHKKMITDHAVTASVGKISEDAQKLIDITKKALEVGIKAVKPGKKTGDIGFAIEEYIKKQEKKLNLKIGIIEELAGHGVGYAVHEDPFVPNFGVKNEGVLLEPGMVIAIEPMLTLGSHEVILSKDNYTFKTKDHSLAAHFEHTVVITEKGADILTNV
jgi:methionyl aminopeptidase